MADKKVKITGEVQIDGQQAGADINKINEGFSRLESIMNRLSQGNELILRSLSYIAKSLKTTETAAEGAADAAKDHVTAIDQAVDTTQELVDNTADVEEETSRTKDTVGELVDAFKEGVVDGMEQAVEESKKVNRESKIMEGLFHRIGHTVIDGLVAGIRTLAGYFASLHGAANEFDKTFDRMGARGVRNIAKLRTETAELAALLGADLVEVAQSVDLAESLGAGEGVMDAVRAAWENFRVTGMDVNRQIEISTRLSRAFNLEAGEQADLINRVAEAAQKARVSQEMLWNGMSAMGPRIRQLGGNFEDLMRITTVGIAEGIKAEEEGLQGLNELLSSLISPSEEFGKKLVELGVISTQSSRQWRHLSDEARVQKEQLEGLNQELSEYRRELAEINYMTSAAERAVRQYNDLNNKRSAGQRLNRLERQNYRELRRELESLNKELSTYDRAGNIVERGEFTRLATVDQLTKRIEAAKSAQEELNLASQQAQLEASDMATSVQSLDVQLTAMSATLMQEIPAAIRAAITDGGLGEFMGELAAVPAALKPLSAEVQTLVSVIGNSFASASGDVRGTDGAVSGLAGQFAAMYQTGTDGLNQLRAHLQTLGTVIMGPVTEGLNKVARVIIDVLSAPFADGSTIMERVSTWSQNLSGRIITDIESVVAGDKRLGDVLGAWFDAALERIRMLWAEYAGPMITALMDSFKEQWPAIRDELVRMFAELGRMAASAFGSALMDPINNKVGGWMDSVFQAFGAHQGSAQLGRLYMGDPAVLNAGSSSPGGYTTNDNRSTTVNVSGAGDPNAVADAVMRKISQQDRLGYSGSRAR